MKISKFSTIIFDSDGVLIEEGSILQGASELTSYLLSKKKKVIIFSNNSTKHPNTMKKKYNDLNISFTDIITSSMLVIDYLKSIDIKKIYVVGEDEFIGFLIENGFIIDNISPKAVIVGMDRTLTYEKLAIATRLIRNGARFIASNPDKGFPTPRGIEPGAGSMIAALIASTEKEPEIILGKPNKYGFEYIFNIFDLKKEETLMIGDRFETDIIGAMNAGIEGLIVRTGIAKSRNDPGKYKNYKQVQVVENLLDLLNNLKS